MGRGECGLEPAGLWISLGPRRWGRAESEPAQPFLDGPSTPPLLLETLPFGVHAGPKGSELLGPRDSWTESRRVFQSRKLTSERLLKSP